MPEADFQSLYYSAFANSDSLAILCSKDGHIKAISNKLLAPLSATREELVDQQILVADSNNTPSLNWLINTPAHEKEWLVNGQISISGNLEYFKSYGSLRVKKLLTDNTVLIGYELTLAVTEKIESTLPQQAWLSLYNDSTNGIILFDSALNILSTNSALRHLVGITNQATTNFKVDDLVKIEGSFIDWLSHAKNLTTSGGLLRLSSGVVKVNITVAPFEIGTQMLFWCIVKELAHISDAQHQLDVTLSHFKTLFENHKDGIALSDSNGIYIEANDQLANILGYDRSELIGQNFAEFSAENSFEMSDEQWQNFVNTGFAEPFEKRLACADGSDIHVSVQLLPHYNENKQHIGSWSIVHPISREEQQSRRHKQRFELLLERSLDAIAYSNFDGRIEVANQAFCDLVGRYSEEVIGMHYKDLTLDSDLHREQTIYKDQLLKRGYSEIYTKNFTLKTGELVPVSIRTVMIRSETGEPEGVWSISRDNKLRDRLVNSLAESEYRFRSLFSNSFDAIALWSPDDEIKYANKAYLDLIGYSHEELRNFTFRDFTPPGWEEVDAQMLEQIAQRGYSDIFEKEVLRRNGVRIPISLRASGMKDSDGNLLGSWVIIRDISDYRNAHKKLEHSQNLLRQTSRMSRVGGWELDVAKREFIFTEETYRILSIPAAYSLTAKSLSKFFEHKYETMAVDTITQAYKTDTHQEAELKLSGFEPVRWIRMSVQVGYESGNRKKYLYGAIQDISDFKQKEESLESDKFIYKQMAFHDPLTQLPNRLLLADRFEQITNQAKRDKKIVALLVIDLDNFKQINDEHGHPAGDALLKELSSRLSNNVRINDTVSRLGGDEFVIIARLDAEADLTGFATKILQSLNKPINWQELQFISTASIGAALYPKHGDNFDALYTRADKALYWRKHNHKNGFTIAD